MEKTQSGLSRRSFVGLGAMAAGATALAAVASTSAHADEADEAADAADEAAEEEAVEADLTDECDIAIVGCGITGFVASSAAANAGAKVVAIDPASSIAATNAVSTAGIWAIESAEELKYDNHLTVEDMFDHIWAGTHYQTNARALRNLLPASGKAVDLVMDSGIEFMYAFADTDVETAGLLNMGGHIWLTEGLERAELLQNCIDYYGAECRWGCTATELLTDEAGAVTGVRYTDADGQVVDLSAAKVIVCTGGFIQNIEMVEKYYAGAHMYGSGSSNNKGDGINMCLAVGAQMGKNFSTSINESGACNVKASTVFANTDDYNTTPLQSLPLLGCLFVNKDGVRFMNEGKMATETMYCAEPLLRESQYYVILDQATVDEFSSTPLVDLVSESAYANMAPVVQASFVDVTLTSMADALVTAEEEGWAWVADDVATLAETAGLAGLEATVAEYNEYCAAGFDDLMYKDAEFLRSVETGPFYAVQLDVAAWLTLGGIKTDECCRALDAENNVIENLYVAGADGDFWSVPYYQGGSAQGFCFASGYLAATTAAAEALA